MKNGTITFRTNAQKALWDNEICGQLSDGYYENAVPWDHWKFWSDLDSKVGSPKVESDGWARRTNYDLTNHDLLDVVGERMLLYAKAAKAGLSGTAIKAADDLEGVKTYDDYKKNKKKIVGLRDADVKKIFDTPYHESDLRRDLREIADVMKTAKGGNSRAQSIKKEAASAKDMMRVREIIDKADGDEAKEVRLAQNMAHAINTYAKAVGRQAAAEELGKDKIAAVFAAKAKGMNETEKRFRFIKTFSVFESTYINKYLEGMDSPVDESRYGEDRRGDFGVITDDDEMSKFAKFMGVKAIDQYIPLPDISREEQKKIIEQHKELKYQKQHEEMTDTTYWNNTDGGHGWACAKCGEVTQWG